MTEHQSALVLLIKSALTGESYELPKDFDLAEVLGIAKCHGVDVMAYYGAILCGVNKNTEVMREESKCVYQGILISEKQMEAIRQIMDAFEAHGVIHMPLKGALLKSLYPHAEMRRMGDADILINCDQYEIIRDIMKELGYEEKYESNHELVWEKVPVNIELHKYLIPSYNKDYFQYYGDGWKLAVPMDGYSFRCKMNACDEMVYLFTHFAKHYRDAGIGIRHLVDLWIYRKHNPDMNEKYIRRELEKLQLLEFYDNILNTLSVWFEDCRGNEKTEFITQVIFSSGEYGRAHNSNLSSMVKSTKKGQSAQAVKWKRVFSALFPGYTEMSKVYPILKKFPILLPFMWVARFVERIFHAGKIKRFVNRRLKIKANEISEYQQSLNYVGLDFNFSE